MLKIRGIKLSVLFISGITVILLALTIVLSYVSLDSTNRLGQFAIATDRKNIKDTATLLFLEITNRTAEAYSSYFDNIAKTVSLLADYSSIMDSKDHTSDLSDDKITLSRFQQSDFYIDARFQDRVAVLYWGDKGKLNDIEKKIDITQSWFLPYVNGVMNLNKTYFFSIWLVSPEDKFYFSDTYPFKDNRNFEIKFYEKIKGKRFLKNFFQAYIDQSKKTVNPVWWKPYKGISNELILSVSCPVYEKKSNKLRAVIGIDIRLYKILNIVKKASMISEKRAAEVGEWKSLYNRMEGFTFILNRNAETIVFPSEQLRDFDLDSKDWENIKLINSRNPQVKKLAEEMIVNDDGIKVVTLKGVKHIIAYSTIRSTGWILGFVTHENALMSSVDKTAQQMHETEYSMRFRFIVIALVFFILIIVIIVLFFRQFLFKPLGRIRGEIRKMGEGNFNINLKEGGTEEIAALSFAFNYLGKKLRQYIENLKKEVSARQAIETEIELASKMQRLILPKSNKFMDNKKFELYSKLVSAKDVSGDFYDYFYKDQENIVFLVADVSGKGMQAAFFMAMSKVLIKNLSSKFNDPAEVLIHVNNTLSADNEASMFVTVFLAFYNIKTGEIKYSNGGHHDALLLKNNEELMRFGGELGNIALGFIPDVDYLMGKQTISKNDTVIIYTDGIVEAVSPDNIEYGEERLMNILVKNRNKNLKELADVVVNDVHNFEQQDNQFDDITILLFRRL